jgi:hypothetical protein
VKDIIADLKIGGIWDGAKHYAIFKVANPVPRKDAASPRYRWRPDHRADQDKRIVFVDQVQIVQGPEGVIPSWVWLQRADDIEDIRPGTLHFFLKLGFKFVRLGGERKVSPLRVFAAERDKLTSQEVERSPVVVDDITHDRRVVAWNGLRHSDYHSYLSALRVALGNESIRVSVEELENPLFELLDVGFGPFNL